MNQEKIIELLSSEEFVKEFASLATVEEKQKALNKHGANVTMEEVEALMATLKSKANCELDDEALASVAGGAVFRMTDIRDVVDKIKNPKLLSLLAL